MNPEIETGTAEAVAATALSKSKEVESPVRLVQGVAREEQLSLFPRSVRRSRVELTRRDLEVLEFILEMKFASVDEVFEKFFSKLSGDGEVAASSEWARKRLRQLMDAGYLRTEIGIGMRERVFIPSFKTYHALTNLNSGSMIPKPTRGLDFRTFVHDRELLLLRLKYERELGDVAWISDRRLKQGLAEVYGIHSIDVPDAIVRLPDFGLVVVELEIAMKSRKRYREKIARYVRLIRDQRAKPVGVRKVIFHCLKPAVVNALQQESKLYSGMIEVIQSASLISVQGGVR